MQHLATDVAYVGDEHLWLDAAYLAGLNVLLWLVSLRLGKCWPVDFIWSGWPPERSRMIIRLGCTGSLRPTRASWSRRPAAHLVSAARASALATASLGGAKRMRPSPELLASFGSGSWVC